jgi:hypothetical protein
MFYFGITWKEQEKSGKTKNYFDKVGKSTGIKWYKMSGYLYLV